jgi:hypothetical protein
MIAVLIATRNVAMDVVFPVFRAFLLAGRGEQDMGIRLFA